MGVGWAGLAGTHLRFLLRRVSLSKSAIGAVEMVGASDAKTCPRILRENYGALDYVGRGFFACAKART